MRVSPRGDGWERGREMRRNERRLWPLLGGLAVILGVTVLGGVALSGAGPAGTAAAVQSNDTDWNATNGSEPVAADCPPADALRKEVFDGLETRSIEEVRSTIPSEAVRCLPEDVREVLDLGDETDDDNSTDVTVSTDDCPPTTVLRLEVDAALADESAAAVREELSDEEIDCLPSDLKDRLDVGGDSSSNDTGGTDGATDGGTGSVECPSDGEIRDAVETALEDASAATVREQIPEDYEDCLPADVRSKLNIGTDVTVASAVTESPTPAGDDTGTAARAGNGEVDCPPVETIREEVNRTLERMSAAQFRTMVPNDYVECFPPDLRERLGLPAGQTASGDGETSVSADAGGGSADSPVSVGSRDSKLFDSDGDGVVNARDYAPNNANVQFGDSDGDGVPDPYDHAPQNPNVQHESDAAAADPGRDSGGGGDGISVAAGSALLLVLTAGAGIIVYRHYSGADSGDDGVPQPVETRSVTTGGSTTEPHDVFGESAFDPSESVDTRAEFSFDDHEADDGGFVFDNGDGDEDVITLDSGGSVVDEAADTGFVFDGGANPELDDASEPADD